MKKTLFILLAQSALLLFIFTSISSAKDTPCKNEEPAIIVYTEDQKLHLCNGEGLFRTYSISIGQEGWGKKKQGDNRTPVGRYSLGKPRPSNKFHIFIPIEYPTPEQREQGYTGGDIGIHGPWQPFKWLGGLNNLTNWTRGCIAVSRNSKIEEISKWVRKFTPAHIYILDDTDQTIHQTKNRPRAASR